MHESVQEEIQTITTTIKNNNIRTPMQEIVAMAAEQARELQAEHAFECVEQFRVARH